MSLDLSSSFPQFRISMAGGSKNGIFAFDNFRLDVDKLMLYRDGEEVLIAAKIAKTLTVLVEHAGTIISKDELIEKVWDDSIVEESNLTQYLYLLRKVLGTMPDGRSYIETLRRRGYRFNGAVKVSESVENHSPRSREFHSLQRIRRTETHRHVAEFGLDPRLARDQIADCAPHAVPLLSLCGQGVHRYRSL